MTIEQIAQALRDLTPAEKMELADQLYDDAGREVEAAAVGQPRKRSRANAPVLAARGPALDPWAGFTERLLGRATLR